MDFGKNTTLTVLTMVIAVLFSTATKADIAFSDDFTDGNRDGWYKQASSPTPGVYEISVANDAVIGTGNALIFTDGGTGSTFRKLVANTKTCELTAANDYVTLSFDLHFINNPVIATTRAFRFGLFDCGTTKVTQDVNPNDSDTDILCDDDKGYHLRMDTGSGGTMYIYPDGTSGGIMGGSEVVAAQRTYSTFNNNLKHHVDFTVRLMDVGGILYPQWEVIIDGVTDTSSNTAAANYKSFNEIGFASAYGNDFAVDNVVVTSNKVAINVAPNVNAGGYLIKGKPAASPSISFNPVGTFTDDGKPAGGTITYTWSVVDANQASHVVITNGATLTPTIDINAPGLYPVRLRVNDGELDGNSVFYAQVKDSTKMHALQAHWKFDGNAADDNDYYYKRVEATIGYVENLSTDAKRGKSLSLTTADHVGYSKAIGAEPNISIAFWMKPDTYAFNQTGRGLISKYPDTSDAPYGGWTVQYRALSPSDMTMGSRMLFRVGKSYGTGGGDNSVIIDNGFAAGEWVHIAVTFDSTTGTSQFYRNGVLVGTDTTSNMSYDPTKYLQIGEAYWSGLIDEMYLYDYPISIQEIRQLYTMDGGNAMPMVTTPNVVNAVIGVPVTLNATIMDENPSSDAVWTIVEGPGTATYGSLVLGSGTASRTATFSAIGDYTLHVAVTDNGGLTGTSSDFIVKVRAAEFNGLEAYFTFDTGFSSSVAGGVTYTGVPFGTAAIGTTAGKIGGGLVLDPNSHLDFNKYLGAENNISVMCWYKTNVNGAAQRIVQKWASNSSGCGWALRLRSDVPYNSSGVLGSAFNGPGVEVRSPDAIGYPTGTWTHVALTFDGTTAKLYHNGTFVDDDPGAALFSSADNVTPFVVGYRSNNSTEFFNGVIDELRVYSRAVTYTEIKDIYTANGGVLKVPCISGVIAGDLNDDCYVNLKDVAVMGGVWLNTDGLVVPATAAADIYPQAPADADGAVNMGDLKVLVTNWLSCVDPSIAQCL